MKRSRRTFLIEILTAFSASLTLAQNTTYYVDRVKGSDGNDGKSERTPWKTLHKVNSITFQPGDKILLRRNQTFEGTLLPKGSGVQAKPIKIGAYGKGKRPIINASGNSYALRIMDSEYWEIADLEATGAIDAGIFIGCTKAGLVLDYFRITNCYVHDIGNETIPDFNYSTVTGGIVVANGDYKEGTDDYNFPSIINDAIIDGCIVRYLKRWTCISISSGIIDGVKGDGHRIRNCTVEYSVADGIRMKGVKNSFIESSTMYKNGAWPNTPNKDWGGLGAWFFLADNCTIQFCEASYIDNWHKDGGAFDIDYYQSNSTIQYCYGHDCHGYGASIFGADKNSPTVNSTIRYNIFSNNGRDSAYAYQGDICVFTWRGGLLDGMKIYNNTSYWNPASDAPALVFDADVTGSNPNIFKNNIIYSDHSWLVSLKSKALQCDNNIYWATNGKPMWVLDKQKYFSLDEWRKASGMDAKSLYADPMLVAPNYHGTRKPTSQCRLRKNSPAIDQGTNVGDMGKHDFFGDSIPGKSGVFNIGACELED